jgi:hypothetical protein
MSDELLDLRGLAAALGITYSTARTYRSARFAGADLLPPEDFMAGGHPVWRWSTVRAWLAYEEDVTL